MKVLADLMSWTTCRTSKPSLLDFVALAQEPITRPVSALWLQHCKTYHQVGRTTVGLVSVPGIRWIKCNQVARSFPFPSDVLPFKWKSGGFGSEFVPLFVKNSSVLLSVKHTCLSHVYPSRAEGSCPTGNRRTQCLIPPPCLTLSPKLVWKSLASTSCQISMPCSSIYTFE